LEELSSYSNPSIKLGINPNKSKNPIRKINLKMNNNQKKNYTNSYLRNSQSLDQKAKHSSTRTDYSNENILNNSLESKMVIRNEKDDILDESEFRINVKLRVELCSPEEFTFLESVNYFLI
jgi:hypothetical protein